MSPIKIKGMAISAMPLSQTTVRKKVMGLAKQMMLDANIEQQLFEAQVAE